MSNIQNCAELTADNLTCSVCYFPKTGPLCETTFMEQYTEISILFIFYVIYCVFTSVFSMGWAILAIRFNIMAQRKFSGSVQIVMGTYLLIIIGNIFRVLTHIDPLEAYGVFPYEFYTWSYNIASLLIICLVFAIVSIWLDLTKNSKVVIDNQFRLAKICILISSLLFCVLLLGNLAIGTITKDWSMTNFVNNVIYFLVLLVSSIIMIVLGCKFLAKLGTTTEGLKSLERRVSRYIIINGIAVITVLVFIGIIMFVNPPRGSVADVVLKYASYLIFRTGEFFLCCTTLMISSRPPWKLIDISSDSAATKNTVDKDTNDIDTNDIDTNELK
eukprot:TRINITY_DN7673_c0_g1_i1.p1 TRINITY_DN7673_c0_g1~~TRINITY_DN7673_c0_g1_i1.p1  ORF type:complete len:330 (+),score=22.01 TRINITY_DN7673_c0_g1_i1:51-1040(+)